VNGVFDNDLGCITDYPSGSSCQHIPNVLLNSGSGAIYQWYGKTSIGAYDLSCVDPDDCGETTADVWSDVAGVQIYYPDISSITPSSASPGERGTFTIAGLGLISPFLNPPTVTVTNQASVFSSFFVLDSNYTDGTITVSYTVLGSPTTGTQTITVNNGFGSDSIAITVVGPPIIDGPDGTPVQSSSTSPISVLAGQPISLSVAAPSGQTIQSQSWVFGNPGDVVAGFNGTLNSGGPVAVTGSTSNNLNCFFIVPGETETVTVNVTYSNGATASATEWYSVSGPTGDVLPTVTMLPNNQSVQVVSGANGTAGLVLTGTPVPGTDPPQVSGAVFQTTAEPPADNTGAFIWVQLITGNQDQKLNSTGPLLCPAQPQTGLDTIYPNDSGVTVTEDMPSRSLIDGYGESETTFNATMYLMWDPAIPPPGELACQVAMGDLGFSIPSTCVSIPVPLGSVSWHWSGCAINTLTQQANGTSWALGCGLSTSYAPQTPNYAQNYGYPTWTQVTTGNYGQCVPANQ